MKKLLFIIPGLKTGGTNSSLNSLVNLIKDKAGVHILTLSYHDKNHDFPFEDKIIKANPLISYLCTNYKNLSGSYRLKCIIIKGLAKLLKIFKLDIYELVFKRYIRDFEEKYHFDYVVAYEEGLATKFASFFVNRNKIAWIHCNYNHYLGNGSSEESIYQNFFRIVCVSKYTSRVFSDRYPSLGDRTLSIYNIVDTSHIIHKAQMPIEDQRFKTDRFVILSVGRFNKVKRFSYIPQLAALLKKRNVNFYWYVIGPQTADSDYNVFNANIKKYGVDDNVIWLGPKNNPYPYFKNSNLYVCLSLSEACPMVFIEAAICNLPLVSTSFPSAKEFIRDNYNDYISDIDNLDKLIYNHYNSILKNNCIYSTNYVQTQFGKIKDLFEL